MWRCTGMNRSMTRYISWPFGIRKRLAISATAISVVAASLRFLPCAKSATGLIVHESPGKSFFHRGQTALVALTGRQYRRQHTAGPSENNETGAKWSPNKLHRIVITQTHQTGKRQHTTRA